MTPRVLRSILYIALVWVTLPPVAAHARLWTDKAGRSVEAEFVRVLDADVVLKLRSGKILKIPLLSLSQKDQRFVLEQGGGDFDEAETRIWTDVHGMQVLGGIERIEADRIVVQPDKSVVHAGDSLFTFSYEQLSAADRIYVRRYVSDQQLEFEFPEEAPLPQPREWSNRVGERVVAQFDRVVRGQVFLAAFGSTRVVPYAELSPGDQTYIVQHLSAQGQAHTLPDAETRNLAAIDLAQLKPGFTMPVIPEPPPPPPIDVVADATPNAPTPTPPTTPPTQPAERPPPPPPLANSPSHSPRGNAGSSSHRDSSSSAAVDPGVGISPTTAISMAVVGGLMELGGVWWIGAIALQKGNPVWGTLCFLCCGLAALIYGFCNTDDCGTPLVLLFVGAAINVVARVLVQVKKGAKLVCARAWLGRLVRVCDGCLSG